MEVFNKLVSTAKGAVASAAEGAKGLAEKVMPKSDAKDAMSAKAATKKSDLVPELPGKTMTGGRQRKTRRRQNKKRKTYRYGY
jgi:hypothetical protein